MGPRVKTNTYSPPHVDAVKSGVCGDGEEICRNGELVRYRRAGPHLDPRGLPAIARRPRASLCRRRPGDKDADKSFGRLCPPHDYVTTELPWLMSPWQLRFEASNETE